MPKSSEVTKDKEKKDDYDRDALLRFICGGLYGFGCGTDHRKISTWRKVKNWEEKCRSFHGRNGD